MTRPTDRLPSVCWSRLRTGVGCRAATELVQVLCAASELFALFSRRYCMRYLPLAAVQIAIRSFQDLNLRYIAFLIKAFPAAWRFRLKPSEKSERPVLYSTRDFFAPATRLDSSQSAGHTDRVPGGESIPKPG